MKWEPIAVSNHRSLRLVRKLFIFPKRLPSGALYWLTIPRSYVLQRKRSSTWYDREVFEDHEEAQLSLEIAALGKDQDDLGQSGLSKDDIASVLKATRFHQCCEGRNGKWGPVLRLVATRRGVDLNNPDLWDYDVLCYHSIGTDRDINEALLDITHWAGYDCSSDFYDAMRGGLDPFKHLRSDYDSKGEKVTKISQSLQELPIPALEDAVLPVPASKEGE